MIVLNTGWLVITLSTWAKPLRKKKVCVVKHKDSYIYIYIYGTAVGDTTKAYFTYKNVDLQNCFLKASQSYFFSQVIKLSAIY